MTLARPLASTLAALAIAGCSETLTHYSGGQSTPSRIVVAAESRAGTRRSERNPATADSAPSPATGPGGDFGYRMPAPAEEPAREAEAQERPGLGTEWGETRVSRVRDVPFERGADRPVALATIFYNDRQGVDAMVQHHVRNAAHFDAPIPVRGGITASVVDENGRAHEAVSVAGRVYVVGEAGRRYSLVVANRTARRIEVVASVDGLDVVDGQPASVGKRGYVLDPFGTVTIDGFRQNHDQVAAFRFGSVAASYAERTGEGRNVGVIGVAFFDEQGAAPWGEDEVLRRRAAEPFSDARFSHPPL
ncbi:MAG: hypothetical protein EXR72_05085 [Myxococcales bacterium]|nr:hypothetical protein [Myxococcales bacterium]